MPKAPAASAKARGRVQQKRERQSVCAGGIVVVGGGGKQQLPQGSDCSGHSLDLGAIGNRGAG